jgi:hypothetical protein
MPWENSPIEIARQEYAKMYWPQVQKLKWELFTGKFIGRQPSEIQVEICVDGLTETVQDQIVALLPVSFEGYPVEIRLMEQGELDMSEKNNFLYLS